MPKGHGARLVKPPSQRQQIHAQDYSARPENVIAIHPKEAGLPTSSWWATPRTREAFDAAVAKESGRMRDSRYGRINGVFTEKS